MGKLYWKEGERNKHDTVQSNWAGTVMLGTGAMQIAHALDGEATKNQLAGAAIFWGLSIPEFINQRDDFNTPMLIANASMCTAMGAVLLKAHYPAMHALIKSELDHREVMRSRERFQIGRAHV